MWAPRKGKHATFSEALFDVQTKHDKIIQLAEEQAEQLRMKEDELNELRRQMAKFCQVSSELPSSAATDSESTSESPKPTLNKERRFKLSRMPAETIRDALSHLDRFSIDATQIVCPRFRFAVEEMLTGVCLRELDSVEMYAIGAGKWAPKDSGENVSHEASTAGGFAIRYSFTRKTQVSDSGMKQEQSKCIVTFQCLEDASEHLFGLIRSSTFKELTLRSLTLRDEFFAAMMSVAPVIFVKALTLQECDVSNADAGVLQHALLQFPVLESLVAGHHEAAAQISDAFLEAAVGRKGNYLSTTIIGRPVDDAPYHATDTGILRFLFQPTEKKVTVHLWHVSLSPTFCAQLFQLALANPAHNLLELHVHNFGEHEQQGLEAYHVGHAFSGGVRYGVDAPLGMRLNLLIHSTNDDYSLIFRRNEADSWSN